MKSAEVDALDRNRIVAVCCISALEQHSLHLPFGTDFYIGGELIRRIEDNLPGNLLCLPTVWLGASEHHMDFAGTVSARTSTMRSIVHDIATSMYKHGFRKVLILNSHGGNRALLACVVQDLGHEIPDLNVVGVTYWDVSRDALNDLRETGFGGMGHACELETSIMLAVQPGTVDMSLAARDGIPAQSEYIRGEMLSAPMVSQYKSMKQTTRHGGVGDPSSATADKGEKMLVAITERLISVCRDILDGKL